MVHRIVVAALIAFVFTRAHAQVPTIASFIPASGPVGTSVTIAGTNFSATTANNIVYFGATRASVTSATTTQLVVPVPMGATYQPIAVTVGGLATYSAKPFLVTFAGGGIIDATSLSSKIDFAAGTQPYHMAIHDLDGDGKSEMIAANSLSNSFSVYRNISSVGTLGAGSFSTKSDFTTGAQPVHVAVGDLDGDGIPDLAVANYSSASVSVFRNTSTSATISFAAKNDFTTASQPINIAIQDLDGDGKLDLAVANDAGGSVSVLRNTSVVGTVSFAPKVDFTTGTGPRSIAAADLDGDGKPDLAVANNTSNSVSVFRNTSTAGSITSGSFATKVDFTTDAGANAVAIGDVDGDGKPDLASSNNTGNTVSVFRNTSSSGIINLTSFAARVDFATGVGPFRLAFSDINGDGKLDMITSNNQANTISLLRNTSTSGAITAGSFNAKVDFTAATSPLSVASGDLDGDGKPDLTVANYNSASVSVFRNTVVSSSVPTISSFTPTSGAVGTSITITGTNFDTTPANNTVRFNGTTALVSSSTATSIITSVPAGATSGRRLSASTGL